jgi:hypothetical protein
MNWKSVAVFVATLAGAISTWGLGRDWTANPAMLPGDWFVLLGIVASNVISWFNAKPTNGGGPKPA